MQYMLLVYESPEDLGARTTDKTAPLIAAWRAYHRALMEAGVHVDGNPLQPVASATTIRVKDGKHHVQDGPYADTKEQLGGYIILELPSLDAALAWAARCPAAVNGAVEVRPLDPAMRDTVET